MNILVINCGSSSIKTEVINAANGDRLYALSCSGISGQIKLKENGEEISFKSKGFDSVLTEMLSIIKEKTKEMELIAVGHRVVHGAAKFQQPVRIDLEVKKTIEELSDLAPLHNPINLAGIKKAESFFDLPHVAVFDTAFHYSLPNRAKKYAIDQKIAKKHGIQRYGFHGTSHEYVAKLAAKTLKQEFRDLRIISCHLGNGCSVTAIQNGRSVETSMGMTPLEGLVMGTRSGDIDPGVLLYLQQKEAWSPKELNHFLNKESGLKGLSGLTNNMKTLLDEAQNGHAEARQAIGVFTHQLTKYIGAYVAVMGGVDVLIFTGGIGENSAIIRERVCQNFGYLGLQLNLDTNRDNNLSQEKKAIILNQAHSRVHVLAVKTDEQYSIARQTLKIALEKDQVKSPKNIPVGVSGRHAHLTQETVDILFGKGYQLTEKKPLSQPGQFAANETIAVVGPKNTLERVRILGPVRSKNQIEISRTDEFYLGLDAPIRDSGNVAGTPGATIIGPKGKTTIKEGLICAWRHIHMTEADAEAFGVKNKDIVEVKINNVERPLTFGNVLVRVSNKYALEMHIDTDEANAAEINTGEDVLMLTDIDASLVKRQPQFIRMDEEK